MSEPSMQQLAVRLARGEEAAFAELYDACADRLHHYLTTRLGSRDAASDVLQSVFLRVVKSRRRFRGVGNPIAYVFGIARNEAVRSVKKRHLGERSLAAGEDLHTIVDGRRFDDEDTARLAIARLDAGDRELVELKIYGGLTFREIADVVGQPQATVATRYRRAIESLRGWFTKQCR
jgi:RNA polymerase sigma-70 factor (ECF subfamily)